MPRKRPMPDCLKLHKFCRALCCRTIPIDVGVHEDFPYEKRGRKRVLPRVTINEHLYPGGESVCIHWNPKDLKCNLKSAGRKAPESCETKSCLDHPYIWDRMQKRLAMAERGETLSYDPEEKPISQQELEEAREEIRRLNLLRKR